MNASAQSQTRLTGYRPIVYMLMHEYDCSGTSQVCSDDSVLDGYTLGDV